MLSRTSTAHAPVASPSSSTTALIAGLLGAALGALALVMLMTLQSLGTRVEQQATAMETVQRDLKDATERQRVVLDALSATNGAGFLDRYTRVVRERDTLADQLANERSVHDLLLSRDRQLTKDLDRAEEQIRAQEPLVAEAKNVVSLRRANADLQATETENTAKIRELTAVLDTVTGKQAQTLHRRYQTTWYLAVTGWAASTLLILGLILAVARSRGEVIAAPPADGGPSPHRII